MRFLVYHYRFSLLLVARSNPLSLNQVRITKRLSFSRRRGFEFPRERQLISSEESIACKIADLTTDRSYNGPYNKYAKIARRDRGE